MKTIAPSGIDCVCYLAKDLARARTFYETVIGLRPSTNNENWCEYDLADGTTFGLAQLPGGAWYPTGGVMFAVDDPYAAAAQLAEAGIRSHGAVIETPVCEMAWFDDTEGNNFSIHRRKVKA